MTEATQGVFEKREQDMTDCLIRLTLRKILRKTFYKAAGGYGKSWAKDLKAVKQIKTMNEAIINSGKNKRL